VLLQGRIKAQSLVFHIAMVIDSHQHFWQVGRFDYSWMSPSNEVLYRDYLPGQLQPLLSENNVSQTVLVQASNTIEESRWLLELANENEFIGGVVGWVDLMNPEVDRQLDELTQHEKFKGVRHLVESEPDDDWLTQTEVLRGFQRLSRRGLSYDLLVHTRHLKHLPKLAESCPELRFVIDHMAKPPIASGELDDWFKQLKPIAAFSNVHCKLSGLVTEANWKTWTTDDLKPFVDSALELFGPGRLMFGSDHPVCLLAASYRRVLDSFQEILKKLTEEERQRIFATNAISFYRLN